ncbi:unnamed protein product, partial [Ectocarpus sp. 8 AP-2014]
VAHQTDRRELVGPPRLGLGTTPVLNYWQYPLRS